MQSVTVTNTELEKLRLLLQSSANSPGAGIDLLVLAKHVLDSSPEALSCSITSGDPSQIAASTRFSPSTFDSSTNSSMDAQGVFADGLLREAIVLQKDFETHGPDSRTHAAQNAMSQTLKLLEGLPPHWTFRSAEGPATDIPRGTLSEIPSSNTAWPIIYTDGRQWNHVRPEPSMSQAHESLATRSASRNEASPPWGDTSVAGPSGAAVAKLATSDTDPTATNTSGLGTARILTAQIVRQSVVELSHHLSLASDGAAVSTQTRNHTLSANALDNVGSSQGTWTTTSDVGSHIDTDVDDALGRSATLIAASTPPAPADRTEPLSTVRAAHTDATAAVSTDAPTGNEPITSHPVMQAVGSHPFENTQVLLPTPPEMPAVVVSGPPIPDAAPVDLDHTAIETRLSVADNPNYSDAPVPAEASDPAQAVPASDPATPAAVVIVPIVQPNDHGLSQGSAETNEEAEQLSATHNVEPLSFFGSAGATEPMIGNEAVTEAELERVISGINMVPVAPVLQSTASGDPTTTATEVSHSGIVPIKTDPGTTSTREIATRTDETDSTNRSELPLSGAQLDGSVQPAHIGKSSATELSETASASTSEPGSSGRASEANEPDRGSNTGSAMGTAPMMSLPDTYSLTSTSKEDNSPSAARFTDIGVLANTDYKTSGELASSGSVLVYDLPTFEPMAFSTELVRSALGLTSPIDAHFDVTSHSIHSLDSSHANSSSEFTRDARNGEAMAHLYDPALSLLLPGEIDVTSWHGH